MDACVIMREAWSGARSDAWNGDAGAKGSTLPRSRCAESLVIGIGLTGEQKRGEAVPRQTRSRHEPRGSAQLSAVARSSHGGRTVDAEDEAEARVRPEDESGR